MLEAENLRILSVYHHLSEAKTILKADVSKVNVALYTLTAKEVVSRLLARLVGWFFSSYIYLHFLMRVIYL